MSKIINIWEWYLRKQHYTMEQIQKINQDTTDTLERIKNVITMW